MIDNPDQITPKELRSEASSLEYTGRPHHAEIMRWVATMIEEQEETMKKIWGKVRALFADPHASAIEELGKTTDELAAMLESPRWKELHGGTWADVGRDGGEKTQAFFGKEAFELFQMAVAARQDRDRRIQELEKKLAGLEEDAWNRAARQADQERKDVLEGRRPSRAEQEEANENWRRGR